MSELVGTDNQSELYEDFIRFLESRHADGAMEIEGKCWELSMRMHLMFPKLIEVWGWVECELGSQWPHAYCKAIDGAIYDPTRSQFRWIGAYGEWPADGVMVGVCYDCKALVPETYRCACGRDYSDM